MDALTPWHLLILAGVFVMLFGAKKLPDFARSVGKSARILKTELKDLHEDDKDNPSAVHQVSELPVAPVTVVAPPTVVVEAPPQPVTSGDQTPAP